MRKIISIIFILSCIVYASDQKLQKRAGTVSFVTSKNVYLKFESTEGLVKDDTIFTEHNGKINSLAVVKFISSKSCAAEKIGSVDITVGDAVFIMVPEVELESITKITIITEKDSNLAVPENKINKTTARQIKKERPDFYGSLNVNSFSNYANYPNSVGLQRYSYSLNLSAEKINGSSLSFSNYMYLSYLSNDWHDVRANVFNNLKIFDLALNYSINGYNLWFGRHINYNVSNVGPVDGLQAEKKMDSFSLGAIFGSRPDFYNMGINSKYFEYGVYLSRADTINNGTMQNTVAFFEQTYQSKTDRRFLYFQHSNNIASNINIFASS